MSWREERDAPHARSSGHEPSCSATCSPFVATTLLGTNLGHEGDKRTARDACARRQPPQTRAGGPAREGGLLPAALGTPLALRTRDSRQQARDHTRAVTAATGMTPLRTSHQRSPLPISWLNRTAHTLAVYASQPRSLAVHARLAPGWQLTLAGRGSMVPAGARYEVSVRLTSLPPHPGFTLRNQTRAGGPAREGGRLHEILTTPTTDPARTRDGRYHLLSKPTRTARADRDPFTQST